MITSSDHDEKIRRRSLGDISILDGGTFKVDNYHAENILHLVARSQLKLYIKQLQKIDQGKCGHLKSDIPTLGCYMQSSDVSSHDVMPRPPQNDNLFFSKIPGKTPLKRFNISFFIHIIIGIISMKVIGKQFKL